MAGDWLPIDCNLATKPEVLELVDVCGCEPDAVVGRIVQLWLWASMNAEAGQAKMTPPRMARMFGGDVDFWHAVADVGWLVIDAEHRTITIPKWEERFGQAAKERALKARRNATYEAEHPRRKRSDGAAPEHPAHERRDIRRSMAVEERRGDRGEYPPPPRESCAAEAWETLRTAWNAGPGKAWKLPSVPNGKSGVLDDPAWLPAALEAIPRLRSCRYFTTPVTLPQFMGDGFVQNTLGGQYDEAKAAKPRPALRGIDEPPPPRQWTGDDAARFEATKAKVLSQIAEAS